MRTTAQTHQQPTSEFSTKDIYLATTIKQAGIPIVRVEASNGRHSIFVFQASDKIEEIKGKYDCGELSADPDELLYLKALTFVCRK